MKMKRLKFKNLNQKQWLAVGIAITLTLTEFSVMAQDANAGINEANTKVRSYFTSGTNLMYAVGAILGLIGGKG